MATASAVVPTASLMLALFFLTKNQLVLVFCSEFIQVCDIKLCRVDNFTLLNCSYPRHWLRELRSHLACIHSFCVANVSLEYV